MIQYLCNMTWQQIGLALFVVMVNGAQLILLYDLWLYWSDRTMITDFCRSNPWAAFLIIMAVQVGVVGLSVHFMAQVKVDWLGRPLK